MKTFLCLLLALVLLKPASAQNDLLQVKTKNGVIQGLVEHGTFIRSNYVRKHSAAYAVIL